MHHLQLTPEEHKFLQSVIVNVVPNIQVTLRESEAFKRLADSIGDKLMAPPEVNQTPE